MPLLHHPGCRFLFQHSIILHVLAVQLVEGPRRYVESRMRHKHVKSFVQISCAILNVPDNKGISHRSRFLRNLLHSSRAKFFPKTRCSLAADRGQTRVAAEEGALLGRSLHHSLAQDAEGSSCYRRRNGKSGLTAAQRRSVGNAPKLGRERPCLFLQGGFHRHSRRRQQHALLVSIVDHDSSGDSFVIGLPWQDMPRLRSLNNVVLLFVVVEVCVLANISIESSLKSRLHR
mmetsp:Transcript_2614/g.5872  ORF Transcript_2614/g.5872 Transcript_2614/m.5872 type:complete len:231 (+) Transcript_2614:369-1061(+)